MVVALVLLKKALDGLLVALEVFLVGLDIPGVLRELEEVTMNLAAGCPRPILSRFEEQSAKFSNAPQSSFQKLEQQMKSCLHLISVVAQYNHLGCSSGKVPSRRN